MDDTTYQPTAMLKNVTVIKPQAGPQYEFLASTADIVIYGGAAFGGKTYGILMEAMRHKGRLGFDAVVFRRTYPQITQSGGLWDTSMELYPKFGGSPKPGDLTWVWPSGHRVMFRHLQHEKDRFTWMGSAIPLLCFDELTHFTQGQFFYLISRNRMYAGAPGRPYVRATCNPDSGSWVAVFISWWIDQETGLPIPERSGKVRWMARKGTNIIWGDTAEELIAIGLESPKSVTFIPARAQDNAAGLERDPNYIDNLKMLSLVERAQLLDGNWKIRAVAGTFFRREWFGDPLKPASLPTDYDDEVRYWDRAASVPTAQNPSPDATSGTRMIRKGTKFIVTDEVWLQGTPGEVQAAIKRTAVEDDKRSRFGRCTVVLEEDPGQAGKSESYHLITALTGHRVEVRRPTKSKQTRASPLSTQVQNGNVKLAAGAYVSAYVSELELFPEGEHDDRVDSASGAFNYLSDNATASTKGRF